MTKITLRDRSGRTLFACVAPNIRHAVQQAVSSNINLDGVVLAGCDLRSANLDGASLRSADLRDCDLTSANLAEADLRDADLTGARLVDTCLCEANLTRTDLSGSAWGATLVHDSKMQGTILPFSALQSIDWRYIRVNWPVYVSCDSDCHFALHAEPILLCSRHGWRLMTADGLIAPLNTTINRKNNVGRYDLTNPEDAQYTAMHHAG